MDIITSDKKAVTSFYDLKMKLNNGQLFDFNSLRNKKVLIVNTASACGYTPQYDGLQNLYNKYNDCLMVLGFPSNDFGEQEKADDAFIEQFCKINFGVTFPLMAKSTVKKSEDQNPVFRWLSNKEENGWNDSPAKWNFAKYLINESGDLTHLFSTAIEPEDEKVVEAIEGK